MVTKNSLFYDSELGKTDGLPPTQPQVTSVSRLHLIKNKETRCEISGVEEGRRMFDEPFLPFSISVTLVAKKGFSCVGGRKIKLQKKEKSEY